MTSSTLASISEVTSPAMKSEELDNDLKNLCILKFGKEVGLQKFNGLMDLLCR